MNEILFLGHIILKEGISVDLEKIEAVVFWKAPKNVTEIKSFLGLTGYYQRFIEGFSRIAKPMTSLTQKGVKFEWNEECERSFNELKKRPTSAPILATPSGKEEFTVYCDASKDGLGSVLT